jgi:hypothetical protein
MFAAAKGMDYRDFLDALHARLRFDWYLEIGSRNGRSLDKCSSPTIAVDPKFRIRHDIARNKPQLHLFQETSDAFFGAGRLKSLQAKPGFSFLDGMHLFEFLLRDFMNTEAASTPQSVIALHDCVPFGHGMTTRDLDNIPRGAWTGDVWKLIPILQEYRPDLKLEVLDCAPTGLVILSGLSPRNRALSRAYDRILAEYRDLTLMDFGVERFFQSFAWVDAARTMAEDFATFRPVAAKVLDTPAPPAALTGPQAPKPAGLPAPALIAAPGTVAAAGKSSLRCHDVTLHFGHRVLRDFTADLARGILRPVGHEMDVYVGVHAVQGPLDSGRFKVGIQTEQYLDRNGQAMWRKPRRRVRRALVSAYDVFLDLNPTNAPAYAFLPQDLRDRMVFGPHIFPTEPVALEYNTAPPLFFGSLNERRRAELDNLQKTGRVALAPHGTFGKGLTALLKDQGGVLNIHYMIGEYSEFPRFLKAYLHGKPVFSEAMSDPLVLGTHYFDLTAKPTKRAAEKVLANVATLAQAHGFQSFLDAAAARAKAAQGAGPGA